MRPWKYVKVTIYNIRNGAIRWQITDFLSDGNSNVCCISHHFQNIRKITKCQKFLPWKWRSKSRRTVFVPFIWKCSTPYRWILFRILAIQQQSFMQKDTHIYIHSERQGWWLNAKSAKQICLKMTRQYITLLVNHLIQKVIQKIFRSESFIGKSALQIFHIVITPIFRCVCVCISSLSKRMFTEN